MRNRVAGFFEAGKVPEVWKVPALLRLHGLDGTIITVEENTLAIWFFLQGQPTAIVTQPQELLDEIMFTQVPKRREPADFGIRHTHLSRPAAAGGATLTCVEDRHMANVGSSRS